MRRLLVAVVLLSSLLVVASASAAPVTPTNVVASQASTTSVKLTWDASPDPAFSYFAVRRCDAASCPADLSTWTRLAPNYTTPTATDTGLTTGHTYRYFVTEVDTAGAVSGRSAVAEQTLVQGCSPCTPTGVTATGLSSSSIRVNWDASPDPNFSYFAVRRSTDPNADPTTWTRLAPNYTTPTATDTGLTPGTTYYYFVTEVSSSTAVSNRSAVASAATNAPAPVGNPTPTGTKIFTGNKESDWPVQSSAGADRITDVADPLGQVAGTVMKFSVNDNDTVISPNPRAQLETNNVVNPGDEIWFGGKILLPAGYPTPPSSGWTTFSSVYGPPYAGASPAPLQIVKGAPDSEPTLGIVNSNWTTRYWGVPFSQAKGRWVTWLIHERFATSGWMEAWVDGVNVMPRRNLATVSSANDGGANHISNTFYREKGMFPGTVTMYHANFGVWKVQ